MQVRIRKDGTVVGVGSVNQAELARLQAAAKRKAREPKSQPEAEPEAEAEAEPQKAASHRTAPKQPEPKQ